MKPLVSFLAATVAVFVARPASAQPQLPLPEASPSAVVTQTVGVSTVTVSYHRPGVKGRPVWGGLVPYGQVWRAGANENTTVSFSHDVLVGRTPLPAGTYGLHTIPTKGDWTVIFSRNATSWGSYFYKEAEDALRVTVTPRAAEHREWLSYEFSDLTDSGAVLNICWEKLAVPIALTFDTPSIVLAHARTAYLRGMAGFTWQGFNQAAQYCARKNANLTEALAWADRSIAINENFTNVWTKAEILDRTGRTAEAEALREKSKKLAATEADVNTLGYSFLMAGKTKDAVELFEKNVKNHPDSWNAYDSLAEGLEKSGDVKGAIKNYERALKLAADDQNRKRITDTIAKLKAK